MPLSTPFRLSVGPSMVPLGSVVVDHVENHFDSCAVQCFHHVAELGDRTLWVLARAVSLMGCEEGNGRVAPVIDPSRRTIQGIKLENGQQLHGRNAKLLEVRNLFNNTGECAPYRLRQAGTRVPGEPTHVHLVDDCS